MRQGSHFQMVQNEDLYKISNDKGVTVVNFASLKIEQSNVQCSHIVTFISLLQLLLLGERTIRLTTF
jgi:hypothetical protein